MIQTLYTSSLLSLYNTNKIFVWIGWFVEVYEKISRKVSFRFGTIQERDFVRAEIML